MYEYIELGSVPADEQCFQVGSKFEHLIREECRIYKEQLKREFPESERHGVFFLIRNFSHDFRTYYEVCAKFSEENEQAQAFAYKIQENACLYWDTISLSQI